MMPEFNPSNGDLDRSKQKKEQEKEQIQFGTENKLRTTCRRFQNGPIYGTFGLPLTRGRGKKNPGRAAAIYIPRKIAGYQLNEIAAYFAMTHYASASGIVTRCKRAEGIA
ncbi:MAG: hypothetical protein ACRERU_08710 [Methylococcales bacterium]